MLKYFGVRRLIDTGIVLNSNFKYTIRLNILKREILCL